MTQLTDLPVATKKLSDPTSQVPIANGLSISKTTSGAQVLLPAVTHDRMIMAFVAEATENYADNAGTQALWSLGETGDLTRWDGNGGAQDSISGSGADALVNATDLPSNGNLFTAGALGTVGCILAAGKEIIVTCTPAVGNGTGAAKIVVITVNAP